MASVAALPQSLMPSSSNSGPTWRADHVVQLDIHPLQRLLHVLDMPRRRNVLPAQTQIVLQTANMRRRNKPRPGPA
jgi:hypothetical protein